MQLGHVSFASAVHPDHTGPVRMRPRAERQRLDRHFRRVLGHLRRYTPAGLSRIARRRRARHIDELERYRRRGRFPKNARYPGRRLPIFVDDVGTRCAMGHLIEASGRGDLVREVAARRNLARVHELAAWPAFAAWLLDNGLTVDEAALIQPSYCEAASNCVCSSISGGMLEGEVSQGETDLIVTITEVHGNVGDVMVGDSLALGQYTQAEAGDLLVGQLNQNGVLVSEWIVDGDQVTVQPCSVVAFPPGTLDVDTFIDATLATRDACQSILGAHDPAWTQSQGDCDGYPGNPGGTDPGEEDGGEEETGTEAMADDGCSMHPGVAGDVSGGAFLVLGAAYLLVRRRR